jgi:hypothetical protein
MGVIYLVVVLRRTDRNLLSCAPAFTQRCAGEAELVFALSHTGADFIWRKVVMQGLFSV